jgi:hypothetical protein
MPEFFNRASSSAFAFWIPVFTGMTLFASPKGEGFQPSPKGTLKSIIVKDGI